MPRFDHTLPRLQSRLRLQYQRWALSRHAKRAGRGRAVTLQREGDLVEVNDGVRRLMVPDIALADDFRNGIAARLEAAAASYIGDTGYQPRAGDVIVDIGAGIGEFTLWCADAGARVVAFEPDPLAYECLGRNIAILREVSAFPYALWKERIDLRLHGSPDTRQSSLIEDGKAYERSADVEAWPLDQLRFMVELAVIDFMKIAGEGVEPEILAGAHRTLKRTRIVAINVGATERRKNLKSRVEAALESIGFRPLPNGRSDTIMALNVAMVGPFNSRARGLRGS